MQIDNLIKCHKRVSDVHDEHLFITTHQVYELWFMQIIFELDSVRDIFINLKVEETDMLVVGARLDRIVKILQVLVDQMMVLETMTPLDFLEFRGKLSPASGFQSMQFRLIENKLGVKKENRIRHNNQDYKEVFTTYERSAEIEKLILESEDSPSLFDVVEKWLERTPGLEENGFNFWKKLEDSFRQMVDDQIKVINEEKDKECQESLLLEMKRMEETFDQVFKQDLYNFLRAKGDRRFTWKALQGAMMISLYRKEVIFHLPFQFLNSLMDIDSLLTKWRYNHVMLVQRQIGSKAGTGGSSGYQYLRSTVSDRYKVFLDLFNLSNYLIPARYVPKLDIHMRRQFASMTSCEDRKDA